MARTKKTASKSKCGKAPKKKLAKKAGKAPRKQLATKAARKSATMFGGMSDMAVDMSDSSSSYCKFSCGRTCSPGTTVKGNAYDTCCKACAVGHGLTGSHDTHCNKRNGVSASSCVNVIKANNGASSGSQQLNQSNYSNTMSSDSSTFVMSSSTASGWNGNTDHLGGNYNSNNSNNGFGQIQSNCAFGSFGGLPSSGSAVARRDYLHLDEYMTKVDDESLSKLSTAQLMQRLRANNLDWKGMRHELVERWKEHKIKQMQQEKSKREMHRNEILTYT